jgi:hypothetical protein
LYSILLCGPLIFLEKKPSLITLRKYQQELAKLALKGENTIILTGTNAGKTYVAFHIIVVRSKLDMLVFIYIIYVYSNIEHASLNFTDYALLPLLLCSSNIKLYIYKQNPIEKS